MHLTSCKGFPECDGLSNLIKIPSFYENDFAPCAMLRIMI